MQNIVYIPLGTRCSSAFVFKDNLNIRNMSLPFDWLDMPIKNIKQFIDIDRKDIEPFLDKFFSEIPAGSDRHPDGTWFPHDTFDVFAGVKDKYSKRLERLFDLFADSGKTLVFLTLVDNYELENENHFSELRKVIQDKCKAKCMFISINVYDYEGCEYYDDQNGTKDVHVNFCIKRDPEDEQFKKFESDIAEKISTDESTSDYFNT